MSEALSSSEIEDVLSSIRRLVSDDMRPPSKVVVGSDKLILTPSLRVVGTESDAADAETADVATPAIIDVVASVSAGVDSQADEWESETGDVQPKADAGASDDDWSLPEFDSSEKTGDEIFADADEDVAEDDAAAEDVAAPAQFLFRHAALNRSDDTPMPGWAQDSDAPDEDEMIADQPVESSLEPDADWADAAEAEIVQELAAALQPEMDVDEIILNDDAREVAIDADMLREIVREVLRDELQGRLGERITRNIRKLVRAEIARVMATDDFL